MISNLVLQDTINGIKNIGRCELTIVDQFCAVAGRFTGNQRQYVLQSLR